MKRNYLLMLIVAAFVVACNNKSETKKDEGKTAEETSSDTAKHAVPLSELKIAFVNADTLTAQYKRVIEVNVDARKKMKTIQDRLVAEQTRAQKELEEIQKKFDYMTPSQQANAQRTAENLQGKLQKMQFEAEQEIADYKNKMTIGNYNSIYEFLDKFAKKHGYDLILSKAFGGELLYANQAIDITEEVVNGLNKEYEESIGKSGEAK